MPDAPGTSYPSDPSSDPGSVPADRRQRNHGWACVGLFALALIATLHFAAPLVLPIVLAVLFNLLLSPAVRFLRRLGLPLPLGALVVLVAVIGAAGLAIWQLAAPAADWFDRAPKVMREVQLKLRPIKQSVEQVQKATEEVEKATQVDGGKPVREVKVRGPSLLERLMDRTQDLLVGAAMMLVLLYFLMASDGFFLRKLVRVTPRLRDKIRAVEIGRTIEAEIGRYFVAFSLLNIAVGLMVAGAMYALDMPNPALWGAMVGLLNFVPYLGPVVSITVISTVSVLSFDTLLEALLPPLAYLAIEAIEGNVVQPMLFGRSLSLNPVAIFVSLLFWGWLWGAAGILLAVPILIAIKIACQHIDSLKPAAEFLDRA
ncbi:MAG TPA: AI-2E family transporter [Burkholderiales bacterium]|nr:AI-2E family transporter [Burkholderiales bacterium]